MDEDSGKSTLAVVVSRQVAVLGEDVTAVRLADGRVYIVIRALCDLFGLDRAAQVRRIKDDDVLAEEMREVRMDTTGGPQIVQVLFLEAVPYWLNNVQVRRVRAEWREKLRDYKKWIVRTVYEAFERELGGLGVPAAPSATLQELMQTRDLLRAMLAMADAHIALETRQQVVEGRMDKAAAVVQDLRRRLHALEDRLDPAGYLTDEQQASVLTAVKTVALAMTRLDGKNHFQAVWSEIHDRWRTADYKHLRIRDYPAVLAFLDEWHRAVLDGSIALPGSETAVT